jgi:hypothetical protein
MSGVSNQCDPIVIIVPVEFAETAGRITIVLVTNPTGKSSIEVGRTVGIFRNVLRTKRTDVPTTRISGEGKYRK